MLRQDPPAGERIVKGGTITLTLSLGPERYPVPDVVGKELAAAKGELEQVKLKRQGGHRQYSDTVPQGVVIAHRPARSDTELKPGDTVTVVVSKGRAPITVPDLIGKNINEARAELQQLGPGRGRAVQGQRPAGRQVIGQIPKAGAGVEKDAEVKLDVSKGPPVVTVPRVVDLPCQQAQAAAARGSSLRVADRRQPERHRPRPEPGRRTRQVPPQTEVAIQCV